MIKFYIITWFIISTHMVDCPETPPVIDKFGKVTEVHHNTLEFVICWESDTVYHKTRIDSRDSAYRFYKEALAFSCRPQHHPFDENMDAVDQAIYNVRIDSVTKHLVK
jgi:hypothetical protein